MNNIYLIGFMGVGKSTTALKLSKELKCNVIDTDSIISRKYSMSIPEIFHTFGEDVFRDSESQCIKDTSSLNDTIVSCGGGVTLREANVQVMKKSGIIVFLKSDIDVILKRLSTNPQSNSRPLIAQSSKTYIERLFKTRSTSYALCCDITIDNTDLSVSETVNAICKELECIDSVFK